MSIGPEWKLLAQGAEAKIFLAPKLINDEFSIVKDRVVKKYRLSELENKISKQRFNAEVRAMIRASKAGVLALWVVGLDALFLLILNWIRPVSKISKVRAMIRASKAGVDVARLDMVDKKNKRLVMEFIKGRTTKMLFDDQSVSEEEKKQVAKLIGNIVAKLHNAGLIHGDLTTSNLMQRDGIHDSLTVIDFGLAYSSKSLEDMGVDL